MSGDTPARKLVSRSSSSGASLKPKGRDDLEPDAHLVQGAYRRRIVRCAAELAIVAIVEALEIDFKLDPRAEVFQDPRRPFPFETNAVRNPRAQAALKTATAHCS